MTESENPVPQQVAMMIDACALCKKLLRALAGLALVASVGCRGKLPETRFYRLAAPATPAKAASGDLAITLESFETDAGYDDDRIVYRTTPYRMDYYQYHRWSAAPGMLVGNFLEQALERSGQFASVSREASDRSAAVVRGRVLAIEEVDTSKTRWLGRVVVELSVVDPQTGGIVWTQQFEDSEPLRVQNPEGLAEALSVAMTRIAQRATPAIADHARRANSAATAQRR